MPLLYPFETLVESDLGESCVRSKEKYYDEYIRSCVAEHARVADLMKFDFYREDGVAVNDDNIVDEMEDLSNRFTASIR